MANLAELFVQNLATKPAIPNNMLGTLAGWQGDLNKLQQQRAFPQFQQTMSQMAQSGQFDKNKALASLAQYDPAAYANAMGINTKSTSANKSVYEMQQESEILNAPLKEKIDTLVNEFQTADDTRREAIKNEIITIERQIRGNGGKEYVPQMFGSVAEFGKFLRQQKKEDVAAARDIKNKLSDAKAKVEEIVSRVKDKYLVAMNAIKALSGESKLVASAKAKNRVSQELLLNMINKLVDPSSAVLQGEAARFAPPTLVGEITKLKDWFTAASEATVVSPDQIGSLVEAANAVGESLKSELNTLISNAQKSYIEQFEMLTRDTPEVRALLAEWGILQPETIDATIAPSTIPNPPPASGGDGGAGGDGNKNPVSRKSRKGRSS